MRLFLRLFIGLMLVGLGNTEPTWAREVNLRWQAVSNAVKYDLEIQRDGDRSQIRSVNQANWSGELEVGFYTYRIRAVDFTDRPGDWSALLPLVVLKQPPHPGLPANGSKITLYHPKASVILNWERVDEKSKYLLEVFDRAGKVVFSSTVGETATAKITGLSAGEYRWHLRAVVVPSKEIAARFPGVRWESSPSDESSFSIRRAELASSILLSPLGLHRVPQGGAVDFVWRPVEGAEGYQITLRQEQSGGVKQILSRAYSSDLGTSLSLVLKDEGAYSWEVQALAHFESEGRALAIGPSAKGTFRLDRNAMFSDGNGHVAFSFMPQWYAYKVTSTYIPNGQTTQTLMHYRIRLSGERWFKPAWGASLAIEEHLVKFNSKNEHFEEFELLAKHRMNLSGDRYGWYLIPKLGPSVREYFDELANPFPDAGASTTPVHGARNKWTVGGIMAGFDLRKQFSEAWSLGGRLSYFYPLALLGNPLSQDMTVTGGASKRNVSIGLEALYWFNRGFGVGLGGFLDYRSISFIPSKPPAGSREEELISDSTNAFATFYFRF